MGLLDQIIGAVTGGKGGLDLGDVQKLLAKDGPLGGIDGVVSKLNQAGLGDKVQSWIGAGGNEPISADEVKRAVPDAELDAVAERAGVSKDEAASSLSAVLPQLVDKLTPDGKLPDMGSLDDQLGKLLGR
jgi:uncharacterized protein YidB (DUF937 family)